MLCERCKREIKRKAGRQFLGTVKQEHVGKSFFHVFGGLMLTQGFGKVCPCDVGKRVYYDHISHCALIENNEQRDERMSHVG